MKTRSRKWRWLRWQRGQALAEYWVTIPAGIILMLAAAGIVQFITNGLTQTVEGLEYTGDVECTMHSPADEKTGPLFTDLNGHTFEVVMDVYDEETNTTQVAYKVTSGGEHDISNWVLGLPPGVAKHIIWTSEPYLDHTTTPDPNSGLYGIKFETGFGGGGGGGKKSAAPLALIGYSFREEMDSRMIIIHLAGYFEWDITDLGVKAGTDVFLGTITAPARRVDPPKKADC